MDHAIAVAEQLPAELTISDDAAEVRPDHLDWRTQIAKVTKPEIPDVDDPDIVPSEQELRD
jgi:hypothetical protein